MQRYASISKELEIRTTNMFDREREAEIKFMIGCSIKILNRNYTNSQENITDGVVSSNDPGASGGKNFSLISSSAQFRKQVVIQVLDR